MKFEIKIPSKKNSGEIYDRYSKFVSEPKARFFRKMGLEVVMARREGIYFFDANNRRYINCHCNGGVFNLGHRNPQIIDAVKKALDYYDIGNHHLISGPKGELAEKIVQSMHVSGHKDSEQIQKVIFGVSGGEAVDLAIKISRGFTKRKEIVSIAGGYHGHTGLAVQTGDGKFLKPFFLNEEGFLRIPFGDVSSLAMALAGKPAAIILETVPATLGMPVFSAEYMALVRKLCDKHGVTFILDEVQTGLSRTGKPWGFQHYNIIPDIVVSGKGLSGGIYPISATCFKKRYEEVFRKDPFIHISTFGGSETGCYAALKVLEIVTEKKFLANINDLSDFFADELEKLRTEFPLLLEEVRQLGLFMGLVFSDSATCLVFVKILVSNGIFAVYAANDKRVMQFLPPLITTREQGEEIMRILRKSLKEMNRIGNKFMRYAISFFMG